MQTLTKEFILQYLNDCQQQQSLDLSNHNIEFIADLHGVNCKLQKINFANNRISNIENINIFTNLIYLNLSHNNICNINGLDNLSLLQILLLNDNKIHTVSSLQPLRCLKHLNHLTIYNNPICYIPHFSLIIKQIIPKSAILDQYDEYDKYNKYDKYDKYDKVEILQKENEALRRMLIIHENSLQKQYTNNNQKFDFKEWRNAFIQQLIEHEMFLKKELEIKQSLKNEIKEQKQSIETLNNIKQELLGKNKTLKINHNNDIIKCKEIISNNMLSINSIFCSNKKKWNDKLEEMNKNIDIFENKIILIKQQINKSQKKTISEKHNLFKQNQINQDLIKNLELKIKNELSVKQFYGEQIIVLTKQNKELTIYCKKQKNQIKNQQMMIANYKLKVDDLINKFFKIKQIIHIIKNQQNDINTSIKIKLQSYLNQINGLKSSLHFKNNQIILSKSFQIMEIKNLIKQQFDTMSNFYYQQYHAMNEKFANINLKINKMSNKFENIIDITEKKQYVLIQQINALQIERDIDDLKDESEDLRPIPRELNEYSHHDNDDDDDDESDHETYDEKTKLENLLKLTKQLLQETEEEKLVQKLFK